MVEVRDEVNVVAFDNRSRLRMNIYGNQLAGREDA